MFNNNTHSYSSFGEAYGSDGARGRSAHSKSPAAAAGVGSYDDDRRGRPAQRNKGWDADLQSTSNGPHTLDDLHFQYKRDAMEITKIRDKEEDEENNRHREAVREMREDYMKRFGMLRAMHARQWEEFVQQRERQRQHQHQHQHMPPASGFGGYKQEYDNAGAVGNPYMGMDLRARYPDIDNYPPPPPPPSRSHENYGEFQHQRHQDYGKAYNRY